MRDTDNRSARSVYIRYAKPTAVLRHAVPSLQTKYEYSFLTSATWVGSLSAIGSLTHRTSFSSLTTTVVSSAIIGCIGVPYELSFC